MMLYPLKFTPIFKDKIWGGQKIKTVLGRDFGELPNAGESWDISGVEGNESIVCNGALAGNSLAELVEVYMGDLVGDKVYAKNGNQFPLLVKVIDANDALSIQVHPDDAYAARVENDRGKTEMWYIVDADEDAEIICGLANGFDNAAFVSALQKGELMSALKVQKVHAGETYFIPAGLPHAIGKGILIAEIQQNCDLTYRVYDYDRRGADGSLRELHIDKACDVIRAFTEAEVDTIRYSRALPASRETVLADCAYFRVEKLKLEENTYTLSQNGYLRHLLCIDGDGRIEYGGKSYTFARGDSILLPASLEEIPLVGNATVLISTAY
jgi:mannose-6-phosphate isomerase